MTLGQSDRVARASRCERRSAFRRLRTACSLSVFSLGTWRSSRAALQLLHSTCPRCNFFTQHVHAATSFTQHVHVHSTCPRCHFFTPHVHAATSFTQHVHVHSTCPRCNFFTQHVHAATSFTQHVHAATSSLNMSRRAASTTRPMTARAVVGSAFYTIQYKLSENTIQYNTIQTVGVNTLLLVKSSLMLVFCILCSLHNDTLETEQH